MRIKSTVRGPVTNLRFVKSTIEEDAPSAKALRLCGMMATTACYATSRHAMHLNSASADSCEFKHRRSVPGKVDRLNSWRVAASDSGFQTLKP